MARLLIDIEADLARAQAEIESLKQEHAAAIKTDAAMLVLPECLRKTYEATLGADERAAVRRHIADLRRHHLLEMVWMTLAMGSYWFRLTDGYDMEIDFHSTGGDDDEVSATMFKTHGVWDVTAPTIRATSLGALLTNETVACWVAKARARYTTSR
jgi:hypothetical protein